MADPDGRTCLHARESRAPRTIRTVEPGESGRCRVAAMTNGELAGKVIVVAGASRGIGKGSAIYLAGRGAAVVCAARTVEATAGQFPGTIHETVDEIRAAGGRATAIRCDIGEERDIKELVA